MVEEFKVFANQIISEKLDNNIIKKYKKEKLKHQNNK